MNVDQEHAVPDAPSSERRVLDALTLTSADAEFVLRHGPTQEELRRDRWDASVTEDCDAESQAPTT